MKSALAICISLLILCFQQGSQTADPQGKLLYETHCQSCHMKAGKGFYDRYPPLTDTTWLRDDELLVEIILDGLSGEIEVSERLFDNEMPSFAYLKDDEIAALVNYIRLEFAGLPSNLSGSEVQEFRN